MPSNTAYTFIGGGSGAANLITSFLADGFTVGSSAEANANGAVYHYAAWASVPGSVAVGSYIGDTTDNRNITGTGFQPEWVVVQSGPVFSGPVHKPASTGPSTDWSPELQRSAPPSPT